MLKMELLMMVLLERCGCHDLCSFCAFFGIMLTSKVHEAT